MFQICSSGVHSQRTSNNGCIVLKATIRRFSSSHPTKREIEFLNNFMESVKSDPKCLSQSSDTVLSVSSHKNRVYQFLNSLTEKDKQRIRRDYRFAATKQLELEDCAFQTEVETLYRSIPDILKLLIKQ